MKKINEYLVLNYPAIWNSRIVYLLGFSIISSVFFLLFIDLIDTDKLVDRPPDKQGTFYDKDRNNIEGPSLFLWSAFVLAWLYFQYHYKPFVSKYSFIEVFKGSLLNLFCVILILLPVYFLYTGTIEGLNLNRSFDGVILLSYLFGLPIVFLPFIIKSYTFSEIVLIIMGLVFYMIMVIFIQEAIGFDHDYLYAIGALHYVVILVYLIVKLTMRKYNRIDKSLIFLLVGLVPWFIAALIEPVFRTTKQLSYNPIPDTEFSQNPEMYSAAFLLAFLFLVFITWYVTKSLKKPMVIK